MSRRWIAIILLLLMPSTAVSDQIRIATYNASMTRSGPGLLLRAIEKDKDDQIKNVVAILQHIRPDILLINEFDFDVEHRAAKAFITALNTGDAAIHYPHYHTTMPNSGTLSGFDLNDDGKTHTPDDAFGYGKFPGQYGMLLLSRFPILRDDARSFANLLWRDLPGATLPIHPDGTPFPSAQAQAVMRLSSKSHWDVPVDTPIGRLHILASHPTPPVFDGAEDRNGLRNADEIRFWSLYLDATAMTDDQGRSAPRASGPAIVMGDLNSDPNDGDSIHAATRALITHRALQDPEPASAGGRMAAAQGGANTSHLTDPALDTADWSDTRGPGNLRVDYLLPSRDLTVVDAGVFWPAPNDPLHDLLGSGKSLSSDHRLVWADITR